MLSLSRPFFSVALILSGIQGSLGHYEEYGPPHNQHDPETIIVDPICRGNTTIYDTFVDTQTVIAKTTIAQTWYAEVTVNTTVTKCITESTTRTLQFTVAVTDTETELEVETETETETECVTITQSTTTTTTDTVPATITTYTTETIFSTTYDPCPTSCSVSAATVTLLFWPTDRDKAYPATYYNSALDHTFTSPSVYMIVPAAKGTNTKGQYVGPSTTSWIIELDLDEVSTVADGPSGSLTRQLTLSDLGTKCPQSVPESAIATLSDPHCAPILAAPSQVRSWAYPCNACGPFGLFDPPYAVPTITDGLIEPTKTRSTVKTTVADPTSTQADPAIGTLLVVYYSDGHPVSTETIPTTGYSGTQTTSVNVLPTEVTTTSELEVTETPEAPEPEVPTSSAEESLSVTPVPLPTPVPSVVTDLAAKATVQLSWAFASTLLTIIVLMRQ